MKSNINICILLTLLIIIILILYFYLNQYSNTNKTDKTDKTDKTIKEHFDGDKFDGFYAHTGFCKSYGNKIPPWREGTKTGKPDCTKQCLDDTNCQAVNLNKDNSCTFFKKPVLNDSKYTGIRKKIYDIDNNAMIITGDNNPDSTCYIKNNLQTYKATKYVVIAHSDLNYINLSKVRLFDNNGIQLNETQMNAYTNAQFTTKYYHQPYYLISDVWDWDYIPHTEYKATDKTIPNFTNFDNRPYFLITILNPTQLTLIDIYNRTDCCQDRTKNVLVVLYDSALKEIFRYKIDEGNTPESFFRGGDPSTALKKSIPIPIIIENNPQNTQFDDSEWIDKGCWFDLNNIGSDGNNNVHAIKEDAILVSGSDEVKKRTCLEFSNKNGTNVIGLQNGNQCRYENTNYNSYKQYSKVPDSLGCPTMGNRLINHVWIKKNRTEIPDYDTSQPIEIKRIVIEREGYNKNDVKTQFINISKIYLYDENKNQIINGKTETKLTAGTNTVNTSYPASNLINYDNDNNTNYAKSSNTSDTSTEPIITNQKPYINFEINLISPVKLSRIDIKNRTDTEDYKNRILGLTLKAYNVKGIEIFKYYFNEVKNYYQIPVKTDLAENLPITVPYSKLTQYVKLEKINYNPYIPDTQLMNVSKIKLYDQNGVQITSGLTGALSPQDSNNKNNSSILYNYNVDPNNEEYASTTNPDDNTNPYMQVGFSGTPQRLSKIVIINRKEPQFFYRMLGVRLSGYDKDNNVLYTYDFTRGLLNYTINFTIESEFNKNTDDSTLLNKSGTDSGISYFVKTIKLQKLDNTPIGLSKIYIYDDKYQLMRNNLTLSINPLPQDNIKFNVNNLIKYDDDLLNITSITKSREGTSGQNPYIQVSLNTEKAISKIVLLNFTENGVLSNSINNTKISLLGTSENELFSYTISSNSPLNKYEIDTQFINGTTLTLTPS